MKVPLEKGFGVHAQYDQPGTSAPCPRKHLLGLHASLEVKCRGTPFRFPSWERSAYRVRVFVGQFPSKLKVILRD